MIKKIFKFIGYIIYNCFFRWFPESYSKFSLFSKFWRALCGKLMLDECGNNVNIERNASFSTRTILGNNSGIGINAKLYGKVIIGNNVMMGPDCIIYTQNHKFDRIDIPMCDQGFQNEKTVLICDDVWIGGRVIILPGVKIGKGTIIGAGSVVTKDTDEYSIYAGNPARKVKSRIKDE